MTGERARLGFDRRDKAFVYGTGAVVGMAMGAAVPFVARLAADLPWIPFQGPLQLAGSFDSPWATWGRPVLGVLAGVAFAAHVVHQAAVVVVAAEWIEITQRGSTRRIQQSDIAGIYCDGAKTVMDSTAAGSCSTARSRAGKTRYARPSSPTAIRGRPREENGPSRRSVRAQIKV